MKFNRLEINLFGFTVNFHCFFSFSSFRFSVKVLTTLCEQIEGVPIAGIIVVGDGQSARSIALSGNSMKIPVLWAKGGTARLHAGSEVILNNFY